VRVEALLLALALAGCGGDDPSPEQAAFAFVTAMDRARLDPSKRREAHDQLSARARAALAERASRAAQLSGWELRPWEMLAPGRVRWRLRFDRDALTARVSGDRAVVTARGIGGGVADIPLVREEGRWRVDLDLPPMAEGRREGRPAP
jgi:hypothetical protein